MVELLVIVGQILGVILVIVALFFLGFGVWNFFQINKRQVVKEAGQKLLNTAKLNCPNQIFMKNLVIAPTKDHSGVALGKILGYNIIRFKGKWNTAKKLFEDPFQREYFVFNPAPFKWTDPKSWQSQDQVILVQEEQREPLWGDVRLYGTGIDRAGFFQFFLSDTLLNRVVAEQATAFEVDVKMTDRMLEKMGETVENVANTDQGLIKAQKMRDETISEPKD